MKLKYSRLQLLIEIAAFIGLLALWIYIIASWGSLPDQIPAHYNGAGVVDRWGGKNGILLLPILGTMLYVLISVVSLFPSIWNIPVRITEDNKEYIYRNTMNMIVLMKLEIILCFSYITYCDVSLRSLGIWFLPCFLIVIFGTTIYYTFKVCRKRSAGRS